MGFVLVMVIASVTRLWNLSFPQKLVFDETYYVKDALTLSLEGHEKRWPESANVLFESGSVYGYLNEAAFVVHPPLGKWLIASGMWLLGPENSFGWRISTAIAGILTVAVLMIVAYRLFGSKRLAMAAGLLLAIDGLAITLSRTALLDATLTLFLLLGFLFFLIDQKSSRLLIANSIAAGGKTLLWFRPWLILSGVTLGAAASIKWSGLYLLAAIGLYVVFSEALLRKNSAEKNWQLQSIIKQGPMSFLNLVPAALLSYLASWIGWIVTTGGYARDFVANNWLGSLWKYHEAIYSFHVGLRSEHSYQAHPIGWLIGYRPTAFFYESFAFNENGCDVMVGCSYAITALGNPLIWLSATAATLYLVYRYSRNRERTVGLVLLGLGALYLPWLVFSERTVFQFYAVSFQPWMILALVLVLQLLYRKFISQSALLGRLFLVGYFALAIALALFFLPINLGLMLPFDQWQLRMWLPSWI